MQQKKEEATIRSPHHHPLVHQRLSAILKELLQQWAEKEGKQEL